MKNDRQTAVLQIIEETALETQEQLMQLLAERHLLFGAATSGSARAGRRTGHRGRDADGALCLHRRNFTGNRRAAAFVLSDAIFADQWT